MNEDHSKDYLLQDDDFEEDPAVPTLSYIQETPVKWRWPLVIGVLALSIIMNLYLVVTVFSANSKETGDLGGMAAHRSPYTGLGLEIPIEYKTRTDYTSSNTTLADEMWESLNVDSVAIVVTPEWAEEKGLPDSRSFIWDKTKRVYYIKVFHQLHCLKAIRKTLHDFIATNSTLVPLNHIEHCLDVLRQDLMCKADDTPMSKTTDGAGTNQTMQCKDFSKLVAWTESSAQHSCYKHLDNYINLTHPEERWAFCPTDSPYYPVMQAYFEKHGHHDPFLV